MSAWSQYTRFFKSILTILSVFLIDLPKYNKFVSSTKWRTLQNLIAWLRSFVYNKNRRGSRTEPGGKPQFYLSKPRVITIYRNKFFAVRKVDNISWSTVTKAFCKYTNIPHSIYPSSRACKLFSARLIMAWEVENVCLKP